MLKKFLFSLSIVAFAIGAADFSEAPQWGVGLPLGAVLLALSFIVMVLEKEMALYDDQESRKPTSPKPTPAKPFVKHQVLQTS
jgi:hypothetical protein